MNEPEKRGEKDCSNNQPELDFTPAPERDPLCYVGSNQIYLNHDIGISGKCKRCGRDFLAQNRNSTP